MKRSGAVVFFALSVLFLCSSWGYLVHRTVNQLAVYQLPASLQPFYHENMEYMVRHSVRPDQRRNTDKEEATRHFIDFEAYGPKASVNMPVNWAAAVKKYSEDTLLKYGHVPYWIMEIQSRLTRAYRSGNKDSILFYAADLAHYVADAHVPLHTTLNYDGQLTNQKGLHSLWESMIPELELSTYQLYSKHRAQYLKNPEKEVWSALRRSFVLVKDVLEEEKKAGRGFTDSTKYRWQTRNGREVRSYTTAFARAYSRRLGNTVNQQLIRSANLCADLWYTAWVDAGSPDLSHLVRDKEKGSKKLAEELNANKKNELIKQRLLLSRREQGGDD